jgi:predicted transcriptional regulator of viral defense system
LRESVANLAGLVDAVQASGRFFFTRREALEVLGVSLEALKKAVRRLAARRRLVVPRRGRYVIVPLEYRDVGAPPPGWFIDDLMRSLGSPYYVGLFSAAAFHGAWPEPREVQIMTSRQVRAMVAGQTPIRFFKKRGLERTPIVRVQTARGDLPISSAEATALDLLRYTGAAPLEDTVGVLSGLGPCLDADRLAEAAVHVGHAATVQRLGHLLDRVGAGAAAAALATWAALKRPRFIPLRSDVPFAHAPKDLRWRVVVNDGAPRPGAVRDFSVEPTTGDRREPARVPSPEGSRQ